MPLISGATPATTGAQTSLFPFGQAATLITRGAVTGRDALGNDTFTPTEVSISRCAFNPGRSVEDVQGRDMVTVQPKLVVPANVVVPAAIDAVIVNGVTYEVDGTPRVLVNPFTGWKAGTIVNLKAVTG